MEYYLDGNPPGIDKLVACTVIYFIFFFSRDSIIRILRSIVWHHTRIGRLHIPSEVFRHHHVTANDITPIPNVVLIAFQYYAIIWWIPTVLKVLVKKIWNLSIYRYKKKASFFCNAYNDENTIEGNGWYTLVNMYSHFHQLCVRTW